MTSTITVTTDCPPTMVSHPSLDMTSRRCSMSPPSTSAATPVSVQTSPLPECTCQNLEPVVERPDGQAIVTGTPAEASATSPLPKRAAGDWSRVAYYTSTAPAQATGLTFMANLGDPDLSGTF
ncbi:hypothetical protein BDW02DRAFT_573252, partial [Decorospora gaudefroyi]